MACDSSRDWLRRHPWQDQPRRHQRLDELPSCLVSAWHSLLRTAQYFLLPITISTAESQVPFLTSERVIDRCHRPFDYSIQTESVESLVCGWCLLMSAFTAKTSTSNMEWSGFRSSLRSVPSIRQPSLLSDTSFVTFEALTVSILLIGERLYSVVMPPNFFLLLPGDIDCYHIPIRMSYHTFQLKHQ